MCYCDGCRFFSDGICTATKDEVCLYCKSHTANDSKWTVTYSDGSTEDFDDELTIELVCAYADDTKSIVKIERT